MRRLPLPPAVTLALVAVATPALVVLPTVARPTPAARAVAPRVAAVPLHGVDARALRELRAATGSEDLGARLAPALRRALAGELAANPVQAPAPQPAVLTGELTPAATGTPRFDLVAVTWDRAAAAASAVKVQVRVREDGGWTGWEQLDGDDDGPDGTSEQGRGPSATAPLLTSDADGVQVRVDAPGGQAPAGLRVDLVDGGSSGADDPAGPAASAAAATPMPTVVTRRQWGADEKLVRGTTSVNPSVKALFVHHTDTTNSYTAAQAYAQVRAIYAFHTKVRGWNDIGYNLLVDRFGRVFEGRRGSLSAAVTGAHTGGFNSQSLGVAVLGTFSTTAPSSAALRGLAGALAWKAAQYEIDPRATARLTSAGGPFTAYKAGQAVRVGAISSHRDVGLTECPGDALWADLPWLRREVAARMAPGLVAPAVSAAALPVVAGNNNSGAGVTVTGTIPTTQRWTLTATPVCGGAAVRTVTGRATGRISARWDLRTAKGALVPPGIYRLALATRSPVGAVPTWTTDVEVLPVDNGAAGTCPVRRVVASDGDGPVQRSVAIGRAVAPDAATVVLAGVVAAGTDGVVAAPLAHALGAPLLLTDTYSLPAAVADDLRRRHATRVVVVGGVTDAVLAQVRDLGVTTVERIAGSNRFDTAAAVAKALAALPRPAGTPAPAGVLLAPLQGGKLAHAATLGAVGAATGRPVLYLTARGVPVETQAAIRALGATSATVVGGADEFSDRAARAFTTLGIKRWTRVVGTGRAGVALALARTLPADPAGAPGAAWAGVPTDAGVPDVVAAGAAGRPIVLLPAVVTSGIASWFGTRRPARTWVLGGTAQVPVPLFAALTKAAR